MARITDRLSHTVALPLGKSLGTQILLASASSQHHIVLCCSAPISCTGLASRIPANRLAPNPDFCHSFPLGPLLTFSKYPLQCSSAQRLSWFSGEKELYCQPGCSTISFYFTLHGVLPTCLPHTTLNATAGDESDSRAPPTQLLALSFTC